MKKIIRSGILVFALLALVAGGTGAFFSDTETSTGNVFTSGSIDLTVDHTRQTYNGVDCQTCEVSVFSSTDTMVIAKSAGASYAGVLPAPAQLVSSPHPAWLTEASVAPAEWIWVTPVVDAGDVNNGAEYTFEDTFFLQGPIEVDEFDLSIASDNGYKIVLNGEVIVDRLGEEMTYNALNPLTLDQQSDFEAALIENGENVLQITVRNKAVTGSNPSSNPAGLIYNIVFTNEDCEAGVADFQATCELWQSTDLTTESFFNFSDIKPQDSGSNLISLRVTSNDAYMCLAVANKENEENTHLSPEIAAGDASAGALTGEMGDHLMVAAWYSNAAGVKGDLMFGPVKVNDFDAFAFADSSTEDGPVAPNVTSYVALEWCMGEMTVTGTTATCDGDVPNINQTQTDAFLADLQFYAVQSRNNDEFLCEDLNLNQEVNF